MSNYERLTKAELIARLRALQREQDDQEPATDQTQHLLHELKVHQIELEMQNRELREAQQALEESRDRYADLYDFAPVGYLTLDGSGRIKAINLTGAALFARERARLEGEQFSTRLATGQHQAFFRHLHETLNSDTKQVVELLLKGHGNVLLEVRLESIAANPDCCHTVLIDMSELRQTKRAVIDRQVRLQAILDTAADAIITIDADGIVQSFNQAAERIFGYAAVEIIGRNVNLLMPSPHREQHDGYIKHYLRTHEAQIIGRGREVEGRRKDGSVFPLDLAVTEVHDSKLLFTGIVRDITQRKAAEAALRTSEEQFRQFAEHAQQVFWIIDLAPPALRYVSAAYEAIWNRPRPRPDEPLQHCLETVHAEDQSAIREALAQAARGRSFASEYRILRPDGSVRWLRKLGFPIRDETGQVYRIGCIAEDITDIKQAEEEMQLMQNEMNHLARLSLASGMASGLAHELGQPLSAVVTYSQLAQRMLNEGNADPGRLSNLLDKVSTQSQRAGQIISQLRRLVRKEKPHNVKVDINSLIREIGELAEIEIRRQQVHLQLELGENLPQVFVDPGQIQQVLLNLISNSVAAMANTPAEQRMLTLRTAQINQDSPQIEIAVADTGSGLSTEAAAKLFKPFFTTKPDGMGLGLSLCRSIINAHQGRLWATPNPERGVTFHFTLPVINDNAVLNDRSPRENTRNLG